MEAKRLALPLGLFILGFVLVSGYLRFIPNYCVGATVFGACVGSSVNFNFFLGIFFIVLGAYSSFLAVRSDAEA